MRTRVRTLSKSDYKLARTCDAKLYFRENGYSDKREFDSYLEVHPRVLTAANVPDLIVDPIQERLGQRNLRPEIFLVRHFPLSKVVGNSSVVEMVAEAAECMLGYLQFALDIETRRVRQVSRFRSSKSRTHESKVTS